MKSFRIPDLSLFVLIIMFGVILDGCAYMQHRGRDAMDILDIGVTVTKKPTVGLYLDFFSITPLGYSNIDGYVLGMGNRQAGLLSYQDHSWGALLWGKEKKGSGEFNPKDPHQARNDQRNMTERPEFNTGIARMVVEDDEPPILNFVECDRVLHLGWIGFHATIRPFEIIDFILGWTTLDISGDDHTNENITTSYGK